MNNEYIEEEITLAELAERFMGVSDFTNEEIYDMSDLDISVQTKDSNDNLTYVPIKNFIVKSPVDTYYTDGKLNVTGNHRIIEDGKEILAKDHQDFKPINDTMKVVDIEVDSKEHSYLANGRLNHNTTSGGKAIPFHASVRLRLKNTGKIHAEINGKKEVVGMKTKLVIVKNRLGPPHREVDYEMYFDSGIDNYGGWLKAMKELKLVRQTGAWYKYTDLDLDTGEVIGEDIQFQSKDFFNILENTPGLVDRIYKRICDSYVFKYRANIDGGIDDVEVVEEEFSEES